MAKIKISQFDTDPANNTDIDGINLAEGMAPGLVNNAIRTLMAQLKNQLTGTDDDNRTIGGNLVVDGTSTLTGNVGVIGTLTIGGRLADAFPSGTKMLFNQTSAPVGWVKDTTHDNKALRVVSGTTGSGGGSVPFTTAFANQNVSDTTLTASQIPSHTHTFSGSGTTGNAGGHSHTIDDPSHAHSLTAWHTAASPGSGGGGDAGQRLSGYGAVGTAGATTGISINAVGDHEHSVSISGTIGDQGGGTAHSHTIDLAVQYVDVIICTKS
jgi:microcystin-dependent protein